MLRFLRKLSIYFLIVSIILFIVVEIKYDFITKIKHVGKDPIHAAQSFYQIVRKEGLFSSIKIAINKFNYDPRLGLNYSLSNKNEYPNIDDEKLRESLPLTKVINKIPIEKIKKSMVTEDINESTWYRSNSNNFSNKYSSLNQINRENVKNLQLAWKYQTNENPQMKLAVQTNPIIVKNRIFIPSVDHHLLSLDAKTGKEIWKIKLPHIIARRGLVWDRNDNLSESKLFVPTIKGVYAVSPQNGEIFKNYGNNGQIGNQLSLISPIVTKNLVIIALIKPSVEAYDLKTGKLVWATSLIKKVKKGLLTGSVPWGGMSYDKDRNMIYLVTGNPRPDVVGISRPGPNKHSNSLIAINSENGSIEWSFQEVAHDLWDYDIASPPILSTITKNKKKVDVVIAVTKIGNTIMLDRDSGKPIYDLEYKRAPVSNIPGEQTEPYQPNIKLPEPFLKSFFEEEDVTNISTSQKENILKKIRNSKHGFFEPPNLGGKITLYGVGGGVHWTGASYNPFNSTIFVPSIQIPYQIFVNYVDLKSMDRNLSIIDGNSEYQSYCASCHGIKREGKFNENGDFFSPALVGITYLRDYSELNSLNYFKNFHQGIISNIAITNMREENLKKINNYFLIIDNLINDEKNYSIKGFWRELKDNKNCPGSKPPWQFFSAINLESGKIIWSHEDSYKQYINSDGTCKKLPLLGFTMTTAGKIVFGVFGKKIKALDITNGDLLWSLDIENIVTAPPSTFQIDNEQYLLFVSSEKNDNLLAFKLPKINKKN